MSNFPPKDPGEMVVLGFNFTRLLEVGETVSSATWAAEDGDGNAAPQVVSGSTTVATPIVKQLVIGGLEGEVYLHRATATTSAGRILVLGSPLRIIKGGYSD